ncbi:MAG: hypothetical protein EAZ89_20090 [Bacteroidetes bacterium]|nr:MAG: hypothetical protein EAZ89_20090 [Bacteroidota bacterium]
MNQELDTRNIWQGVVRNASNNEVRIRLEAHVRSGEKNLISALSQPAVIQNGTFDLSYFGLATASIAYHQDTVEAGTYTLCVIAYELTRGAELSRACQDVVVSEDIMRNGYKQDSRQKKTSGGTLRLTAQKGQNAYPQPGFPSDFYQIQGHLPLTVHDIPVSLTLNYASYRDSAPGFANVFQIQFDREALLQKLAGEKIHKAETLLKDTSRLFFWKDSAFSEEQIRKEIASQSHYKEKLENGFYQKMEEEKAYFQEKYGLHDLDAPGKTDQLKDSLFSANWTEYERLNKLTGYWQNYKEISAKYQELKDLEKAWNRQALLTGKKSELSDLARKKADTYIEKLQVGTAYPRFSILSLDGVIVQGAYVQTHAGKWNVSVTGGRWVQARVNADTALSKRLHIRPLLLGVQAVYQVAKGRSLGIQMVHAQDRQPLQSQIYDYRSSTYTLFSVEAGTDFFGSKGRIEVEWSFLPDFSGISSDSFARKQAARISLDYEALRNVHVSGRYVRRSSSFALLTNPWLYLPEEQYRAEVQTSLFQNRVNVTSFIQKDQTETYISGNLHYEQRRVAGANLSVTLPETGSLGIQYAPLFRPAAYADSLPMQGNSALLLAFLSMRLKPSASVQLQSEFSAGFQQRQRDSLVSYIPSANWHQSISIGKSLNAEFTGVYLGEGYLEKSGSQLQLKALVRGNVLKSTSFSGGVQYMTEIKGENAPLYRTIMGINTRIGHISLDLCGEYGGANFPAQEIPAPTGPGWMVKSSIAYAW